MGFDLLNERHAVGVGHRLGTFGKALHREIEKPLGFTLDEASHHQGFKFGILDGVEFGDLAVGTLE